jgi:hypothetical protein
MSKDRRIFYLTEAQVAYEVMVSDFECMKEKCENALFNAEQAIKAADTSTEARWEINGNSATCSVCGFDTGFAGTALEGQLKMYRFCPNCGHPIQILESAKDAEYSSDAGDDTLDILRQRKLRELHELFN